MLLLVGLGNPGARYVNTRHNIGFMAIEAVRKRHGLPPWRRRFQGVSSEGPIAGVPVTLLLPETYMNESGRAVAEAARFLKLSLDEVTVFHDDIERRPGNVKVKIGGGDRGHNGLRSITTHLGKDYRRVQIGVGRPELKSLVEAWVLSKFDEVERERFGELTDLIAENVGYLLAGENQIFEEKLALALKSIDWDYA